MKKIFSILLMLCMLFALGACNSGDETEKTTIPNPDIEPVEIEDSSLAGYLDNCAYFGRCNWNDFTESEQKAISKKASEVNVKLNVSNDGVITLLDPSGMIIEYGGTWPTDNLLIKSFPVCDAKVAYVYEQAGVLCYVALYMTKDEAKEYAKNFESLGYVSEITEADEEKAYYYDAENSSGQMAFIVYEAGITMLGVMPVSAV